MAMIGTSKINLYNAALFEIGDRKLVSLTENVESRRVLDEVYDRVVEQCLSDASWNFAIRPIKIISDTGIAPNFGFTEIFAKPTDWLKTIGVSGDDRWTAPITQYHDDLNYWASDISPMYVRYVSNDASYGLDLTKWPQAFTRYVELSLAFRILPRLNQNKGDKERLMRDVKLAKRAAMAQDTMNEAQPKFFPTSSWTLARRSSGGGDRGNRGSLIG